MAEWVILGCGYVGTRLARALLADGHRVRACSRHVDRLAPLAEAGAWTHAIDANKLRTFVPVLFGAASPIVVYSIPPVPNMPAGEPVRRAAEAAAGVGAQRFIYLGSTAIYGPTPDGEIVDEDTSVALSDTEAAPRVSDESAVETGRLTGLSTVILRLAAIYGPGRGVRERLKAGNYRLIDDGQHFFSRVHVDDVVGIIRAASDRAPTGAVYCVADDRPTTQREYADWLVARLGCAPPPSLPSLEPGRPRRAVRNRRISNARLKRELSYTFRYPTYLEGELAVEADAPPPGTAPTPPVDVTPAPPVDAPPASAPASAAAAAPIWRAGGPLAADGRALVAAALGLDRLHVELLELPAGGRLARAPTGGETLLYVLNGRARVALDGRQHPLGTGDALGLGPAVRAETVVNDGDATLRLLVVSQRPEDRLS
jgi:nucleoside-diphosphate-sugar epimerase/uncharacterized cupin superfamily protein